MAKFIIYEIWTRANVIEADTVEEAYEQGQPDPFTVGDDMYLSNYHAVEITDGLPKET